MFTIVIPSYNGEKYIFKTIDSILQQTFRNFEIILIDDASKDDTVNMVRSRYPTEVKIIEKKINQGLAKNINEAVSQAKGELIVCLGQDDLLDKNHLNKVKDVFLDENVTICHNASKILSPTDIVGDYFISPPKIIKVTNNYKYEMSKRNIFQSCGLCFRKSVFLSVSGWDESYKLYGEWLVYLKIASAGKLVFIPELISFYRRHDSNITNTFNTIESYIDRRRYFIKCRKAALTLNNFNLTEKIKLNIFYFLYDFRIIGRILYEKVF
ncbi:hypothetical protein B4923_06910 [Brenneria roseae subsp. americana]|uniref:Glycosyltransferase 2-like domain-containing protein n=1 Tax=Brenneria roseae subsp. americana TaxID=1508507 RepID=A0A2U1TWF2_9GAMM|nr:glycosyltransferase [Brenneria roseae]PWC13672.1 hypothetical protein B4923_06910 [Brenneria roseae subsp. americana]